MQMYNFFLSNKQHTALKNLAKVQETTMANIIRTAIDYYLNNLLGEQRQVLEDATLLIEKEREDGTDPNS